MAGKYDGGNGLIGNGAYWSSTALSTPSAITFEFDLDEVNPSSAEMKYTGMPVRCMKQ